MALYNREQKPFGALLMNARIKRGLSRAQLAKETGIAENSLIRYEKAGIEKDGQYPPSPKFAILVFHLGINLFDALFSCLDEDKHDQYLLSSSEDYVFDHPDHSYLLGQYLELLDSNRNLSVLLRILLGDKRTIANYTDEDIAEIKESAAQVIWAQERFDMATQRSRNALGGDAFTIPGYTTDDEGQPVDAWQSDYSAWKQKAKEQSRLSEISEPGGDQTNPGSAQEDISSANQATHKREPDR